MRKFSARADNRIPQQRGEENILSLQNHIAEGLPRGLGRCRSDRPKALALNEVLAEGFRISRIPKNDSLMTGTSTREDRDTDDN